MLGFAHHTSSLYEAEWSPRLFPSAYIFFLSIQTLKLSPHKIWNNRSLEPQDPLFLMLLSSVLKHWRQNPTKAAMLTFSRDKWVDSRSISELTWSQNMLCTNNRIFTISSVLRNFVTFIWNFFLSRSFGSLIRTKTKFVRHLNAVSFVDCAAMMRVSILYWPLAWLGAERKTQYERIKRNSLNPFCSFRCANLRQKNWSFGHASFFILAVLCRENPPPFTAYYFSGAGVA